MDNSVKWAVIPCAGKGTRFLPITKGLPKEMLPIVDRPTLDYIVQELVDSGITNIVFIVSKDKDEIKKYYDEDVAYEKELKDGGKENYAKMIHEASAKAHYYYVEQKELLGLGHAVLQAKNVIGKNNFVVCCGDDICTYKEKAPVLQMVEAFNKVGGYTVVGGQTVDHSQINKYGCMDTKAKVGDRTFELKGIVEKPKLEEAPSDLASLGKWVFNYKIFDAIEHTPKGRGGEIQLTDAIALLMKSEPVYFYDFVGKRYDCGDKLGFIEAIIDVSLSRDDLKDGVKDHIKKLKL
jgi:UDP-glucose pyrophosphorylase